MDNQDAATITTTPSEVETNFEAEQEATKVVSPSSIPGIDTMLTAPSSDISDASSQHSEDQQVVEQEDDSAVAEEEDAVAPMLEAVVGPTVSTETEDKEEHLDAERTLEVTAATTNNDDEDSQPVTPDVGAIDRSTEIEESINVRDKEASEVPTAEVPSFSNTFSEPELPLEALPLVVQGENDVDALEAPMEDYLDEPIADQDTIDAVPADEGCPVDEPLSDGKQEPESIPLKDSRDSNDVEITFAENPLKRETVDVGACVPKEKENTEEQPRENNIESNKDTNISPTTHGRHSNVESGEIISVLTESMTVEHAPRKYPPSEMVTTSQSMLERVLAQVVDIVVQANGRGYDPAPLQAILSSVASNNVDDLSENNDPVLCMSQYELFRIVSRIISAAERSVRHKSKRPTGLYIQNVGTPRYDVNLCWSAPSTAATIQEAGRQHKDGNPTTDKPSRSRDDLSETSSVYYRRMSESSYHLRERLAI